MLKVLKAIDPKYDDDGLLVGWEICSIVVESTRVRSIRPCHEFEETDIKVCVPFQGDVSILLMNGGNQRMFPLGTPEEVLAVLLEGRDEKA